MSGGLRRRPAIRAGGLTCDLHAQRMAMKEASPLFKKLTEEEKARYVNIAEGTFSPPLAVTIFCSG